MTVLRGLAVTTCICILACVLGVATGLAARVLSIIGFYEVLAALTLSVGAVALAHLTRWRPQSGAWAVALAAGLTWLVVDRTVGAWAFREEQAKLVVQEAHVLAEDFLISGADTPMDLVDVGLRAETGADGLRGAFLADWGAGQLAFRAIGLERRLPPATWLQALWIAGTAALLTLIVGRALHHLAGEPRCATCGRFLARQAMGRTSLRAVDELRGAWSAGERLRPEVAPTAPGPMAYEERCPAGHSTHVGYALVQFRGRTLGAGEGGLVARLNATSIREGGKT